jgi:hypothetical protein
MSSLIDVFMPNDLCARCDEQEPVNEFKVFFTTSEDSANLHFCTESCKGAFVRGAAAVKELPDVF